MSADRFNFLEFGEEEGPAGRPATEDLALSDPPQREIGGDVLADGMPLAQVRFADPRGYQGYQEEDEEGVVTLSSLAAQAGAEPTRLRVVEVFGERGDKAGQFQYPTGLGRGLQRRCVCGRRLQSPGPAHHAGPAASLFWAGAGPDGASFCRRRASPPTTKIRFTSWSRATAVFRSSRATEEC